MGYKLVIKSILIRHQNLKAEYSNASNHTTNQKEPRPAKWQEIKVTY